MDDQTLFFASLAPATPDRGHLLARMLRPYASRPNVFVADDDVATRVTIHQDATVDIELVIDTGARSWSVAVREIATGNVVAQATVAPRDRAQLLRELRTFLEGVVGPARQGTTSLALLLAAASPGSPHHAPRFC